MAKKLNDRTKFFTIDVEKINQAIDSLDEKNCYNFKDLKALLIVLKELQYESNIVEITDLTKKHIIKSLGMSQSAFNQFVAKTKKIGIFNKLRNDTYEVNKEFINYGENKFENGSYVKVSSNGLIGDLEHNEEKLSALELKIFFYLLKEIIYQKENEEFGGNIIILGKEKRNEVCEKYDISSRAFDKFISRMKNLNLFIKINNNVYQINNKYIAFGGAIDPTPLVVKEAALVKPSEAIPNNMKLFFNNKGGKDNE